ncbi:MULTISPECIES: hypothetical protein [Halarchaeum]|uniref:Uncharacterized protein n=1 Tax=Halarchaeum nitratireducens TaxID=489913 RepID=A0A830GGC4_9EURY|nr:hypothetical protein [Halarchaeum nitratireducens]GGN25731.1 hypothetical protein GCM10009021_29750 [Halarchaeum nitratireducens]
MHEIDEDEFGGVWAGISTLLVALVALGVFVFTTDPINSGGVIASVALAIFGLSQTLAPRIVPWFKDLDDRVVGLFWILVGICVAAIAVAASPTIGRFGGGLVIGAAFVLYGCFTALGR